MEEENKRRSFLKKLAMGSLGTAITPTAFLSAKNVKEHNSDEEVIKSNNKVGDKRKYNGIYKGENLNRLAFPIGGIGAGMFCLEGTGALSHLSVRNRPEIYNEPAVFAAIEIKGLKNGAKVIEGPVPQWKVFGRRGSGNGDAGATYGLPRFSEAEFTTRFPFGTVGVHDSDLPLEVKITGWSPFIPTDEDNSSLPAGALEYKFKNTGTKSVEAIFSFNSKNFLASDNDAKNSIQPTRNGFVLVQEGTKEKPHLQNSFAVFTDDGDTIVDHCWFRGGWWDPLTMAWNDVRDGKINSRAPVEKDAPGASLFVPFSLAPGATKTIRLMFAWYT
ncbi:MAG: GH116 family glycosyl-hydrolase, partial [Ferruginibacter sp.]